MSEENTPGREGVSSAGDGAPPEFGLEEVSQGKRKWQMEIHPGHVALLPAGETQPYIFVREEFFTKLEFFPGMRFLALRAPRKVNLKMSKAAAETLEHWFGRPNRQQLALLLKRRYMFSAPIGAMFVIFALPLPGAAANGGKGLPFQPVYLLFGLTLLALWAWSKLRPRPVLFLLDAIWFSALAVGHFLMLYRNQQWWWSIWTILLVWMAVSGVKRWWQFQA